MSDLGNLLQMIYDLLSGWFNSFTSHAIAVMEKLNLIETDTASIKNSASGIKSNTDDIKDNTGAIITPVNSIKSNTDSIKTDTTNIKNNVSAMTNQLGTISTNVGTASAFTEDVANNTLDIKDKVVTIASDTTQIRTNTNTVVTDMDKVYEALKWALVDKVTTETEDGTDTVSFDTDLTNDLVSLEVGIEPTQIGTGEPSPDHVRTITGITDKSVTVNGNNVTIALGQTVYNGIINVVSGTLIIYSKYMLLSDKSWTYNTQYGFMYTSTIPDMKATPNTDTAPLLNSDCYKAGTGQQAGSGAINNTIAVSSKTLRIRDERFTNSSTFISTMGNTQIVYPLDVPIEVQLTPSQIATIKGINTIITDGNISVTYEESVKHYLDKQEA